VFDEDTLEDQFNSCTVIESNMKALVNLHELINAELDWLDTESNNSRKLSDEQEDEGAEMDKMDKFQNQLNPYCNDNVHILFESISKFNLYNIIRY